MSTYSHHHDASTGLRRFCRQGPTRKVLVAVIILVLLVLVYRNSAYLESTAFDATGSSSSSAELSSTRPGSIPNIVHLVHLKYGEGAELKFSFQFFLCVYSAYLYIQPSTIFIHTDFNATEIEEATQNGSPWTKKVLTVFPKDVLQLNPVTAPTSASSELGDGLPLVRIEHKSDFVRMQQVAQHGGLYLDSDVLTLRSPAPLLHAGFKAVVGRQGDANINNGCFLATRDSALVALMNRDMPRVFSGEWQQHSIGLLTPLAERLAFVPGEVLIMDAKAFAPTGWWDESAFALYAEVEGDGEAVGTINQVNDVETMDPFDRWTNKTRGREWEMDFSATYFLHAFKAMWGPVPNFGGITVPYVLRRRSNYALAAWPIVMQGIKDGIIDETEDSL